MNIKKNIALALCALALCALAPCALFSCGTPFGTTSKNESSVLETTADIAGYISEQLNRNTSAYTEEDIPEDFNIYYAWWINPSQKNFFDTYNGAIQKDLVSAGVASGDFSLSKRDKIEIYSLLFVTFPEFVEIDMAMTSSNLKTNDQEIGQTPLCLYEIKVTANGRTYNITGDETAFFYKDENKSAAEFTYLTRRLADIMSSTVEFAALPSPSGGYD